MENNSYTDSHTVAGTLSGTLLVLLTQLSGSDMLRSAVLALIGATVGFVVTQVYKHLLRWINKHKH